MDMNHTHSKHNHCVTTEMMRIMLDSADWAKHKAKPYEDHLKYTVMHSLTLSACQNPP